MGPSMRLPRPRLPSWTHYMTLSTSWHLSALQCSPLYGELWAQLPCDAGLMGSQPGGRWVFIFMDLYALGKPLGPHCSLLPPPGAGSPPHERVMLRGNNEG